MFYKKRSFLLFFLLMSILFSSITAAVAAEKNLLQLNTYNQTAAQQQIPNQTEEELISGRELKTKTVSEVAKIYGIDAQTYAQKLSDFLGYNIKPNESFQLLHDNYGLEPSVAKDIALSLKTNTPLKINTDSNNKDGKPTYHLILIAIFLTIAYLITWQLAKKNIITIAQQRKIWNWVLLLSFLISGGLGVLLIIKENFGRIIPLPFSIMYWHAEIGIVMLVSSIFHILGRWKLLK